MCHLKESTNNHKEQKEPRDIERSKNQQKQLQQPNNTNTHSHSERKRTNNRNIGKQNRTKAG